MAPAAFESRDGRPARRAPRSLLVNQAAELLGVSRRTVYNRIREGRLRTFRTKCGSRRVWLDSVETLLREMAERRRMRATGRGAGV